MTDAAWAKGMAELKILPDSAPTDEAFRTHRAGLYRRHLDEFSDAAWLHAVSEAVRRETWFPAVATLRRYAEEYRPKMLALPHVAPSSEEQAAAKLEARKGVELIRRTLIDKGLLPQNAPSLGTVVELSDERRAELKRVLDPGPEAA